ncbi:hypothetical protein ACWEWP_33810 [Streptomyces olivaceus]
MPAVLALLDTKAWWPPRWLDRLLPNVDVEGEELHRELGDTAPPERPAREPETAGV